MLGRVVVILFFIQVLGLSLSSNARTSPSQSIGSYANCLDLSIPNGLRVHWNITSDSIYVMMEQTVTTGWAGLGFQLNGQSTMGPGEFITMWIMPNLTVVAQDRYLHRAADEMPLLDPMQNLENIQGLESDSSILVAWSRLLNTNDPDDIDLAKYGSNLTVLYAFGELPTGIDPIYHGPTNRGPIHNINLFAPSSCTQSSCPDACWSHGVCDENTGTCLCETNWLGPDCRLRNLTSSLTMPTGYSIEYFVDNIQGPRQMTLSQQLEILYVGSMGQGNVYAVTFEESVPIVTVIMGGLTMPNGVAWYEGDLWVSTPSTIYRFLSIDYNYYLNPTPVVVLSNIPTANNNWHAWKYIKIGMDGNLYFDVGGPCNFCLSLSSPGDPVPTALTPPFTYLVRINPYALNNESVTPIVQGIRNTVGFDWDPVSGDMWFNDNGRDLWGANKPWDELNRIPAQNVKNPNQNNLPHYGFPFCYGYGTDLTTGGPDPLFNNGTCQPYVGAVLQLGPHVAPLGLHFNSGKQFTALKHHIVLCEHGSWNRPTNFMTGYRMVVVGLDSTRTNVTSHKVLVQGWLESDHATHWGRPVDVIEWYDGSMLVSDDYANVVYRITYSADKPQP